MQRKLELREKRKRVAKQRNHSTQNKDYLSVPKMGEITDQAQNVEATQNF